MCMPRRHALGALLLSPLMAFAASWPERPITIVVPAAAGGTTDIAARVLAEKMGAALKTSVIVENKAGGGGSIGTAFVARAKSDGYTFFVGAAHHAIAPALYPKLDYSIQTDFIPIAVIAQPPQVIVVHPGKVQAKTVAELVDFARKNPEKLNYASAGNGTTHHLAGELFQISTKTKLTHVPYRGAGPALQDTVAGQVDLLFDGLGSSAAQIQSGALRALAVAAPTRSEAVPDVPTAKEAGLDGYEVSTWYALWAPKGTPAEIVTRMRGEVQKALKTPAIDAVWKKSGSPIPTLAGDDFSKFVTAEVERWGKVVKEAQVKLE